MENSMNQSNSRKIALVTGASRGIGAAIAGRLAADGFDVAVNYVGNAAAAAAVVAKLKDSGVRAIAVRGDVAKTADVRQMFQQTEDQLGQIDVLVNNAGILHNATLAEASDEAFDRQFAVNAKGSFNTMREAAARLQQGGRIVNFSSTLVAMNLPDYGVYTATKAAVESLTQVFAKELRGRGISVNAVAPGPVATELFLDGKTDEQVAFFANMPPLQRLGQPDDIAKVVSFLAGPDGGWVNGQVLRANGGFA
jgi:3-oxoacyl-[acyl-carrier protein] reductase